MKKPAALLASTALLCGTMTAEKPHPPSPNDYALTIHVVASHVEGYVQTLEADAEGRRVVLSGFYSYTPGVLEPADYKARLDQKAYGGKVPKDATSFDHYIGYELLMPDGTTRKFAVVSICTPEARSCTHP